MEPVNKLWKVVTENKPLLYTFLFFVGVLLFILWRRGNQQQAAPIVTSPTIDNAPASQPRERESYYLIQPHYSPPVTNVSTNISRPGTTVVMDKEMTPITSASQSTPAPAPYTVVKGDTLSGIASRYGTTWEALYDKNKANIDTWATRYNFPVSARPADNIFPGEVINV